MTGWRRAFCTSSPKERDREHCESDRNQGTRISCKLGLFSSSSTPRLPLQAAVSPRLRCRTVIATSTPTSSVPNSPKLKCNTTTTTTDSFTTRLFQVSNPSSPRSPSSFSLIKASLRLSKTRCGICLQSVKTGQGTAIFTAECSHSFHFPCISDHIKKNQILACPVCSYSWNEAPFLAIQTDKHRDYSLNLNRDVNNKSKQLRVYDDDEPLMSPTSGARFIPIPETNENEDDDHQNDAVEFQGFFANAPPPSSPRTVNAIKDVELSLLSEAAVVAVGRTCQTYALVLKVKAPDRMVNPIPRAPIDLVMVLDVSTSGNSVKLQMMKRALRVVLSSLSSSDRISIVAFSATSKRLFPLRKMSTSGRRAARRIFDALCEVGQGACVNDALKKAVKVIEDRRERNPVATIILLSDVHDALVDGPTYRANQKCSSLAVSSTRFSHLDIPVHSIGFGKDHAQPEDALAKCLGGLLSVTAQDLKLRLGFISGSAPAEIGAVYSLMGRPTALGSGSVTVGDMYSEEERELLIELKVPISSVGTHHVLSVRPTYKDPSSQELVCSNERALPMPNPRAVRSYSPNMERLRNLHITTRAVAESRRLVGHNDLPGAYHLLSSARALLMQQSSSSANEYLAGLESELADLHRCRQHQLQQSQRQIISGREASRGGVDEKPEPLTPTSAWRTAERLAKVAIMRKSMNRVSDLHGFENARF